MNKNFLFLGFAIPNKEMKKVFEEDKYPAIQTHKFNWNLIKGLEYYGEMEYTYISAKPVSDFPFFPIKKISKTKWTTNVIGKNIEITEIPYKNTSIAKILSRFCTGFYYSIKNFHKVKNKGGIIVYSVHVPFMMIGYLLSKIYKIDFVGIWTDPPSVINARESYLKSKFRRIELYISKALMKRVSKVVVLSKYLAEDFAPKKPYIVVEGIIEESEVNNDISKNIKSDINLVKIVYTGSIAKRYGIKNIVDGVNLLSKNNIVLEIYGKGDFEDELKEISKINKKIRYMGFVPNDKILQIQRDADFLINARSAEDDYVKYSFPSKTLEYMLSGTPLITTMLPGIPENYREHVLVLDDNKPETIAEMLLNIQRLTPEERLNIGLKALDFAKTKSYINQGEKIAEFLKGK